MKRNPWITFGLLALLISNCANANDSLASVGAGGLELLKTNDIKIVSEVLEISTTKVRVKYHFLNTSNKDIKTTVAFPMPAFDDTFIPDGSRENQKPLESFHISVSGVPAPVQKSRAFFVNGTDATNQFRNIGLTENQIFDPKFSCLSESGRDDKKCKLTNEQVAAIDYMRASGGNWQIKETAYWVQTFPAGKEIEVNHEYTPFTGIYPSGTIKEDGCPNEGSQQAIDKIIEKNTDEQYYSGINMREVEYILGTGRNWNGPIKDFRLVIKKDSPDEIISLCFPGKALKTSPTSIEFHQQDFIPQDQLAVYFVTISRTESDTPLYKPSEKRPLTENDLATEKSYFGKPTITLFSGFWHTKKSTEYFDRTEKDPHTAYGNPAGIAVDSHGTIFAVDANFGVVHKISKNGKASVFSGTGRGDVDGPANIAKLDGAMHIAIDKSDSIYVTELFSGKIKRISPDGSVFTLPGAARFNTPRGVAFDNDGNILVVDSINSVIRRISKNGVVTTFADNPGKADKTNPVNNSLREMRDIVVDSKGNVFVSQGNNVITRISHSGVVSTFAGGGNAGSEDGDGKAALFNSPYGLAIDKNDNIYVADTNNNAIRKISPSGAVRTIIGNGRNQFQTGLLPGGLNNPRHLAIFGNKLYINDAHNYIAVVNNLYSIK